MYAAVKAAAQGQQIYIDNEGNFGLEELAYAEEMLKHVEAQDLEQLIAEERAYEEEDEEEEGEVEENSEYYDEESENQASDNEVFDYLRKITKPYI